MSAENISHAESPAVSDQSDMDAGNNSSCSFDEISYDESIEPCQPISTREMYNLL